MHAKKMKIVTEFYMCININISKIFEGRDYINIHIFVTY